MDNIDFSLAPEGATHFHDSGDDIWWYKETPENNMWMAYRDGSWVAVFSSIPKAKIPEPDKKSKTELRVILPQNDKEQMLCEQVLRMCRGEPSEVKLHHSKEWLDKKECDVPHLLNVELEYRAKQKPKFEVPLCIWEFIPKQFNHIRVSLNGETTYVDDNGKFMCDALLTFDTEGYDLPTVAHRPK